MGINATIENGVATVSYSKNGRRRTKNITIEAFGTALSACTKAGKQCHINPAGLRIHGVSGDSVIVGYEFPERVAQIPFDDGGTKVKVNSVWPWGLTFIKFVKTPNGLQWDKFIQFGLTGPITTLDTQLYVWPGSNVYGDHRCCIGSINVPKLENIDQTGGLPYLFYNGVSNTDLSEGRFKPFKVNGREIHRPIDLYKHLQVKSGETPKPFPYDIMKPAMTLKSFLTDGGYL